MGAEEDPSRLLPALELAVKLVAATEFSILSGNAQVVLPIYRLEVDSCSLKGSGFELRLAGRAASRTLTPIIKMHKHVKSIASRTSNKRWLSFIFSLYEPFVKYKHTKNIYAGLRFVCFL